MERKIQQGYQKQVGCSYSCKLICVDDELSKAFRPCSCEDVVYP